MLRTAAIIALVLGSGAVARGARRDVGPVERAFEVTVSRFRFAPEVIQATEGEHVRLTVRSADGLHGLEIRELKVKVRVPKGGEPASTDFVASRVGTFEISCSEYCGSGHRNMRARLVVLPRAR